MMATVPMADDFAFVAVFLIVEFQAGFGDSIQIGDGAREGLKNACADFQRGVAPF